MQPSFPQVDSRHPSRHPQNHLDHIPPWRLPDETAFSSRHESGTTDLHSSLFHGFPVGLAGVHCDGIASHPAVEL
jgi:hypothetical protein